MCNGPSSQCLLSQLRSLEWLELEWVGAGDGLEKTGRGQMMALHILVRALDFVCWW